MRSMRSIAMILVFCLALPVAASDLGQIQFPNSGASEAQNAFMRGVLLLHSFEYEDSREAFVAARTIDPDFALAYWGEAMTHNHPLWGHWDGEAARRALARFAPTPSERLAKTKTERERGYLRAADTLFGDEPDKVKRDHAFSDAMGKLASRYPEDLEARAFYALSILGTAQGVRDFRTYMRAGAIAEEVFDANPQHPGAAHYLIHSYDDPVHAPLGLRAARVYARIAPDATHAQHMISHIWVALGRWEDSVEANEKAVDVSIDRRKRKNLGPDAVSYHSLHWLAYSYLQLGRFADARKALEMMTRHATESASGPAVRHFAVMRATWIVNSGGKEGPPEIDTDRISATGAAASIFATGYHALLAGDRDKAREAVDRIDGGRTTTAPTHGAMGATAGVPDETFEAVAVMKTTLLAAIELDAGNKERALKLMSDATTLEDSMALEYGPPTIVKPSHEIYGEMLLDLDRPADAMVQFEKALERAPRRTLSLDGLARAAFALGDRRATTAACSELETILAGADEGVSLPGVCGQ